MDMPQPNRTPPSAPRHFGFYVGGASVPAGTRDVYERLSPGHDVPVTRIPKCTPADVDMAVRAAREAFDDRRWSGLSGADRAAVLLKTAEILRARLDEIAYWESLENGKPIAQAAPRPPAASGCLNMPPVWRARCMGTVSTTLAMACSAS